MRSDFSCKSICLTALAALVASGVLYGAAALAQQQVWKWVDKNGVVHYSDTPVEGAKRIDINVQTYAGDEAAVTPTPSPSSTAGSRPAVAAAVTYDLIEVWKPEEDSTITGTGGQVTVSVRVIPGVRPGHSVRLELDGQRVSELDSQKTEFELQDVARGTHSLAASIVARDGKTLIQSVPVEFHVLQPVVPPRSRVAPR